MSKIGIYPGTFDPITYGHIDVIRGALKMVNNLNKEKAIIAAVLPTGNKTFFIKLTVSQQGLRELESVFEKFCSSIGS